MKKIIFIFCMLFFMACKDHPGKIFAQQIYKSKEDTTTNPKTEVYVNKKYDDKGNLIRYDSSYSYHYISPGGNGKNIETDTLFSHFKSYYLNHYDTMFTNNFGRMFLTDSLFKYDFTQPDYFSKRFELNNDRFKQMLKDMDSVKTEYLKQGYPQGEMQKKNDKNH